MRFRDHHLALVCLLFGACNSSVSPLDGGADDDAGSTDLTVVVPRTFAEIRRDIFEPTCAAGATCHSPSGIAESFLDLATDPYRALIGVAATNTEAASEGLLCVKPCAPDTSFLWIKLDLFDPRYQGHRYGSPMPLDRPSLPDVQKAAIRNWIARGAPEEESGDAAESSCILDGTVTD